MCDAISVDPDIMGGVPVFRGTRVPVSTLFDYLREPGPDSNPLQEFVENFPSVTPDQIALLLEHYKELTRELEHSP